MSIDLGGVRIIDLDGLAWGKEAGTSCDLCRSHEQLYRLVSSPDALCRSCFALWHG